MTKIDEFATQVGKDVRNLEDKLDRLKQDQKAANTSNSTGIGLANQGVSDLQRQIVTINADIKELKDNQIETDDLSVMVETATAKSYLQAKEEAEELVKGVRSDLDKVKANQPYPLTRPDGSAYRDFSRNMENKISGYNVQNPTDNPAGDWGLLQNIWVDTFKTFQTMYGFNGRIFLRQSYNANKWQWTPWREFIFKDDLDDIKNEVAKGVNAVIDTNTGGKRTVPNATKAGMQSNGNITNLNTITYNGYYYCAGDAVGNPFKSWGTVFHFNPDGGQKNSRREATQFYFVNDGRIAFRHHRNTTIDDDWEGWIIYPTRAEFDALAKRVEALEKKG